MLFHFSSEFCKYTIGFTLLVFGSIITKCLDSMRQNEISEGQTGDLRTWVPRPFSSMFLPTLENNWESFFLIFLELEMPEIKELAS